jgi:hypothetical protein
MRHESVGVQAACLETNSRVDIVIKFELLRTDCIRQDLLDVT